MIRWWKQIILEKYYKYALRQKNNMLQENTDTAAHSRLTAGKNLHKLSTGIDYATNSIAEDIYSQLQQQVGDI